MPPRRPLTVRQRRLAAELLALRGSTPREKVVEDTGVSEGALLKMEKGRTRPQRRTLVTLLEYYAATPEKRAELLDLWQHATRTGDLQPIEESLPENYQTFIAFEAEAASLSVFEGFFVPGLLQTEAYARALIRSQLPEQDDEGIEARVEVRMRRQAALQRKEAVRLWAILDEAVIRRTVGGEKVMGEQLDHLARIGQAGNTVTLQVIPFSTGAHLGMIGAFHLMDFSAPDPAVVYTENFSGGIFLEAEDEVHRYRTNFQRLAAQALDPTASTHMIKSAARAA
jgi:transcriptional regulator with XRE-family HTH domain